jgi:DNA invertase Pin-like site-specific DNA recombinase
MENTQNTNFFVITNDQFDLASPAVQQIMLKTKARIEKAMTEQKVKAARAAKKAQIADKKANEAIRREERNAKKIAKAKAQLAKVEAQLEKAQAAKAKAEALQDLLLNAKTEEVPQV